MIKKMTEAGGTISALVIGGTGEVGREVVKQLTSHPKFSKVIVVARRSLDDDVTSNKIEFRKIDFDNLHQEAEKFAGADVAYCCLGTTRAKAGKEGFISVDRDYVVKCAEYLKSSSCRQFHMVTSQGSNINSNFLYFKTKGQAEDGVTKLNFPMLGIYQPGLLLCARRESRLLEAASQALARGFDWRNKFSVHVETVARAMITKTLCVEQEGLATSDTSPKKDILSHADILQLGID